MRAPRAPADVFDIGAYGEDIGPFLYKLRAEEPGRFQAVSRTLRSIVPSVESLTVQLDERRGTLDMLIRQGGVEYSSRIVSEGTLRVLALCAIAVNPWGGSLLAFEEPENGVHPRRLDSRLGGDPLVHRRGRRMSQLDLERRSRPAGPGGGCCGRLWRPSLPPWPPTCSGKAKCATRCGTRHGAAPVAHSPLGSKPSRRRPSWLQKPGTPVDAHSASVASVSFPEPDSRSSLPSRTGDRDRHGLRELPTVSRAQGPSGGAGPVAGQVSVTGPLPVGLMRTRHSRLLPRTLRCTRSMFPPSMPKARFWILRQLTRNSSEKFRSTQNRRLPLCDDGALAKCAVKGRGVDSQSATCTST